MAASRSLQIYSSSMNFGRRVESDPSITYQTAAQEMLRIQELQDLEE